MSRAGGRPHVRMMMAMTADGKIAGIAREAARFGSREDQRRLEEQVAWADALLIAAGTIRAYGTTFRVTRPDLAAGRAERGQAPQPVTVVITRSLDLPKTMPFFTRQTVPRLIVTTVENESEAKARFSGLAEVAAWGRGDVDVERVIGSLADRGRSRILALGGGTLNFALVKAGCVDELRVTVAPYLFGGANAPTILDGEGFPVDHAARLRLEGAEVVGDEVFLRYSVMRRKETIE